MAVGRFAPSPTGALHLGNLRTAMLAWLFARSTSSRFLVRMEDLDHVVARPEYEGQQLADLASLGVDWDGTVVRQSERRERYEGAIRLLAEQGLTYPCFCTRKEIQAAVSAPHGEVAPYPGTCRRLSSSARRAHEAAGRRPALRLRSDGASVVVDDLLCGPVRGLVDDFVLRRNDGVPAYNLAVVVDDGGQGIEQVVRGDDLLTSSPRQAGLAQLLGFATPSYAHVPLVLGPSGQRLAKRDGGVTLADQQALGRSAEAVRSLLGASMGLCEPNEPVTMAALVERFDPVRLPRQPWVWGQAADRVNDAGEAPTLE